MGYLKYTQYVYLIAAVFFAVKAFQGWHEDTDEHFLFIGIAVLAVFMFFFRRKFAAKMNDRNSKT